MFAVESGHGQSDDFVSGIGHTLHLHASFGAYEQYFGSGAQFLDGIGYGDGGEDVASRAAAADDDMRMFVHFV